MHLAYTGLRPVEPTTNAKPVLKGFGMSLSMGKDDPDGALKPVGHRNPLSFCPGYWITKTMKWFDYSIQMLNTERVYLNLQIRTREDGEGTSGLFRKVKMGLKARESVQIATKKLTAVIV